MEIRKWLLFYSSIQRLMVYLNILFIDEKFDGFTKKYN